MHQSMLMAGASVVSPGPLLHFDGSNTSTTITDAHGGSVWSAIGGAQLSTAQAMFGPSSLFVNSGRVNTADMGGALGAEFCVQGFAYSTDPSPRGIFHTNPNGSANGLALGWGGPSGVWEVYHNNSGLPAPGSVPVGWFHWAVWRFSGTIYIAIEGHILASVADTSNLGAYTSMDIGTYFNTSNNWIGYLDEIFIDLTHPIYGSSDFTPPTAPFT